MSKATLVVLDPSPGTQLLTSALTYIALVCTVFVLGAPGVAVAATETVSVPGDAALVDQPGSPIGASPAVDSELDLSLALEVRLSVHGGQIAFEGATPNYPNGCCFVAEFVDSLGTPILLDPVTYPVDLLCEVETSPGPSPCSIFQPIAPGSPPTISDPDPLFDVYESPKLPVPIGAVGIRYGHFDSAYGDNSGLVTVTTSIETVAVGLDIKPGSDPNCFNINGHGVVPVAILGSAEFGVHEIDAYSLTFDGMAVRVRGKRGPLCSSEDANSDGFTDLVCQFEDDPEYWSGGDDIGTATGVLYDGTGFAGSDSVCIVP